VIAVEGLSYAYPGHAQPAIRGLGFSVEAGEVFGFLGPSGAGKSTTQRILMGLLKGYQGSARAFGRELRSWGSAYYERVGVGFELPNAYSKLTARENLEFFRSLYRRPTADPLELLEQVGLLEHADRRVAQFSKGMRMRLNFCRALVHRPDLIFLDEPTSGQDPVNARRLEALVLDQKRAGRAVFLTTHDMATATALCDRVAFLVGGEIRLTAPTRDLLVEHGSRRVRVEYQRDGGPVAEEFGLDGLGENRAFLRALREEAVETVHSQEATLADIFVRVTGRSLS
jgi:fluoroquinolone transport system ATP-binding protein